MKLSLFTASLLLANSLYASQAHQLTTTQEGVIAIKLLDTVLKTNLKRVVQEESNTTSTMQRCIDIADQTMQKMNNEVPKNIKMSIASLDSSKDATDIKMMKKYQNDIKKKTEGALLLTRVKVGDTTRVYKPLVIDEAWLSCHDDKTDVKLGDFKGVLISEISAH